MESKVKTVFIGFGEVNTPIEVLNQKCKKAVNILREKANLEVCDMGIVNDDFKEESLKRILKELPANDFDFLIVCVAGWIPSHPIVRIVEKFKHKPVLLWGLAGEYINGCLMTTAAQAGTSAIRSVFEELGLKYKFIYDSPDSGTKIHEILKFSKAVKALNLLRESRIGMMGYRDMGLYTTLYDGVSLKKFLGVEIENFEMMEIFQKSSKVGEVAIEEIINKIKNNWVFEGDISDNFLIQGVRYYLAIKERVQQRNYKAISLIDVDGMKKLLNFPPAMILMLLSDDLEICTIPENDSLGSVTQLIVKYLTSQIAAYLEFYEFMDDRLLLGVPDYVPSEIVKGSIKVMPAKFGDFGEGLLNVSELKTGPVTLCRLGKVDGEYRMHLVKGEGLKPRKWAEVGWKAPAPQLPSLEVCIDGTSIEEFSENVLSQHYIISYGDNTPLIREFCKLVGIRIV